MESAVVVITGASGGIGRAAVRKFAERDVKLGLIARGQAGLEAARREVEQAGRQALAVQTDVADAEAVEAAATAIEQALGPIDVWVNDAMVTIYAEFADVEPDEFRRATEVTYHGTVWGTRAALRRMLARDRGTIVQVGSALAYRGIPLQAPYCGAKHAVKGFTESLATELLHRGSKVRLTLVHLPGVNTTQFTWGRTKLARQTMPVPPIYQPEVAAEAIVAAAFHPRREYWVGLPTYQTILGERLAPWLLDRYLARSGYWSQQTDEPLDPERHDNLFTPVDEDRGAHGPFDEQAHDRSPLFAVSRRRGLVLGAAATAGVGLLATALGRR